MPITCELIPVTSSLLIWQSYDPAAKADLFSTAITNHNGSFLIDPIPLGDAALAQLLNAGPVSGIIVTNRNHLRAAGDFADRFSIPTFAHPNTFPNETFPCTKVTDGGTICGELDVIGIEGAAAGEIVLHHSANGGTLFISDALINCEPYGFTFLPRKYCLNEKKMRRSLRKLLAHKTERIFFAHGPPILSRAGERLRQLLMVDG